MAANALDKVQRDSVIDQPTSDSGSSMLYGAFFIGHMQDIIAPWGAPVRQRQLRDLRYAAHNTLAVSAVSNLIRRFKQIDRELLGGRNSVNRFNTMLQDAHFGKGEDTFWEMFWWDYLTLDNGGVIEIIAPGASDTPINRAVEGIAVLDSLRCYATGNPEHPIIYRDHQSGKLYKMHHTRVWRATDGPSSDPQYRYLGLSALSRMIAVARMQMMMSEHNTEKLSDLPPAGILTASGIDEKQLHAMMLKYHADQQSHGNDIWKNIMSIAGINPQMPPEVKFTSFSNLPDNFDYKMYMEAHVNLMALALGDDPTELWTLTGGQMGTGTQSQVMHAKGKQRILGDMIKVATTIINLRILPPALERRWKPKDTQQSLQDAEVADRLSMIAGRAVRDGLFNQLEARQYLANQVSGFADILLDNAGQIRLPDDDVLPEGESLIAEDDNDLVPTDDTQTEVVTTDTSQSSTEQQAERSKDIQATRVDFEDAFADFLNNLPPRRSRARTVATAILGRAIRSAFMDGLEQGGVDRAELSADDSKVIADLQKEANGFIGNLLTKLYKDEVTPLQIDNKPADWFIGSVQPAYFKGIESADKNGMYEWVRHAARRTEESCTDCERLDGQIHRMKDWLRKKLRPGSVKCKQGCGCEFVKREGARARGSY